MTMMRACIEAPFRRRAKSSKIAFAFIAVSTPGGSSKEEEKPKEKAKEKEKEKEDSMFIKKTIVGYAFSNLTHTL